MPWTLSFNVGVPVQPLRSDSREMWRLQTVKGGVILGHGAEQKCATRA